MKKLKTNLTLAAALTLAMATLGGMAHAEDAKPAAKPDNEISYNIGLTSDYRYRGLSQTRLNPALQGGADYTNNPTGLYAGVWASTIKWVKDSGGDGNVEIDLYGGKRGEIVKDVSYDVGGLAYIYPSNKLGSVAGFANANTFELYGQVGYGPVYVKYSHSTTNLFGYVNSKNSGYLDVGLSYDIYQGYTLGVHAGHQNVMNNDSYAYSDYKIGVTKDFGVATVSLAVIKADTDAPVWVQGKNLAKTGAVLTVTKTF